MVSKFRSHVRHNVVGYIALFFALTGVAVAAPTALKNGDPAGGDLTGTYPNPTIASNAVGSAEVINNSLTGADLTADEAPHVVGAAGEPAFGNGGEGDCLWQDFGTPTNPVSFYRGKDGRVHLAGLPAAQNGQGGTPPPCGPELEDSRVFTLPPAYRPANVEVFSSATDPTAQSTVGVGVFVGADQNTEWNGPGDVPVTIPAGAVLVRPFSPTDAPQGVALDGLDFRAAGTGGFP